MINYYLADGWTKLSEEDIYQDGCQPNTGGIYGGADRWRADTVEDLIQQLLGFTGADYEGIDFDACEDVARIDIALMEDDNGSKATRHQINEWKEGKIRLWDCIYSFHINRVQSEPLNLREELGL